MAMDWASGSLYWTDALYNWIAVAAAKSLDVYNHIIKTGLVQPHGIAVYPQKGSVSLQQPAAAWRICRIAVATLHQIVPSVY